MNNGIKFVGPIAEQGGPAIKNRLLIKYMRRTADPCIWNTYDHSVRIRMGAVFAILFSKQKYIIVAVSRKGRLLLYPFLLLKRKVSGIRYACVVIGGNAVDSLNNPVCIRSMKNADLVTVETKTIEKQFKEMFHLSNVFWMPNYKELPEEIKCETPEERFYKPVLKFLFLSSIRNAKGVSALLKAFKEVLSSGYDAELDFYGPIKADLDPSIPEEIESTEKVNYCGFADNDKVLEIMGKYGVFVFPTEYTGEGFPAVLVEAQAAGLPIIASDMNYNPEIIQENRNGWIFKHGDEKQLAERIKYCLDNRKELSRISSNNIIDAEEYDAEKVINSFLSELRRIGWPV